MNKSKATLHDLVDYSCPARVLEEIEYIVSRLTSGFDIAVLEEVHADIIRLFNGEFPGYRASNTKYHNLEHSNAVALTVTRLMHGLFLAGHNFTPREIELVIFAAFFHDTGLIQAEDDHEGTGAKYTIGHEQRSIAFMRRYLSQKGYLEEELDCCAQIIQCTILSLPVAKIKFQSPAAALLGKVMGSADLMAQMADRRYLEKLPLLFREFEEGGLSEYESATQLMEQTEDFYHSVAQRRMKGDLGGVSSVVRFHFRERWGIDRDMYAEAIDRNLSHLRKTQEACAGNLECIEEKLRRGRFNNENPQC